ncbi:hypothetical protein [Prevotella veroralis]
MAQTAIAKVAIAGWTSAVTTLKGVYLLVAAAINVMRGNTIRATAQERNLLARKRRMLRKLNRD